jgi:hypothetical protein
MIAAEIVVLILRTEEKPRVTNLIQRSEAKPRVSKDAPEGPAGPARAGAPFEAASRRLRTRG